MIRPASHETLAQVLEAGIGLEMFGILSAYMLEDGRYAVMHLMTPPLTRDAVEDETIFASADEAAKLFLRWKQEHKVGFEYETEPPIPAGGTIAPAGGVWHGGKFYAGGHVMPRTTPPTSV